MMQRSPTYILSQPAEDKLAHVMRKVMPAKLAQPAIRRKNATLAIGVEVSCKRFPKRRRRSLSAYQRSSCPTTTSRTSRRVTTRGTSGCCLVPNGDLYRTIRNGGASIVTDRITSFSATGSTSSSGPIWTPTP